MCHFFMFILVDTSSSIIPTLGIVMEEEKHPFMLMLSEKQCFCLSHCAIVVLYFQMDTHWESTILIKHQTTYQ